MQARGRYSPGWGLSWQLWRRHRWGFGADLAWLAALTLAANFWPEAWRWPRFGQNLELAGSAVFLHLIAAFSYGAEVDLTANKRSGFPANTFTLPLATRTLVAWPMALGAAAVAGVWLAMALLMMRPCGIERPLLFPAVVGVAALMAVQAVSWAPFEFGWARVAVALPLVLAVLLAPLLTPLIGFPEEPIPAIYLALLPCLFLAAVAGVARARRGDAFDWRWVQAAANFCARLLPERRRPFASAAQAQFWFECRRHAGLLPMFIVMLLIPIAMILFLGPDSRGDRVKALPILAFVLAMPAFLAGMLTPGLGKHDFGAKDPAMPAFLATRPIGVGEFVAAKFKMAAVSTLLAWLVAPVVPAIWLLAPDHAAYSEQTLAELAAAVGPGKLAAAIALAAIGLPALTWRKLTDGMWAAMTGRNWIAAAYSVLLGAALVCVAVPISLTLQFYPEYRPLAWRLLPWLISAAAWAKLVAAALLLHKLRRSRLVARAALGQCLAVWCAITATLTAAFFALAPPGASVWMPLASAILLVPLNRLAVAPLALNWNRHR